MAPIVSLIALTCSGFAAVLFLPLIVSIAVSEFGITESLAGRFGSMQLLAIAVTAALLAPRLDRIDRRRLAIVGLAIVLIATFASMLVPSVRVYLAGRVLSGVGEAMVLAALHAAIASRPDPDRAFATCNFAMLACGVALYPVIVRLLPEHGQNALLFVVAGLGVLALAMVRWLPPTGALTAPRDRDAPAVPTHWRLALVAVAVFYIGEGALWGYLYRIGLGTGLGEVRTGEVLATAFLFSMAASVVAHRLSTRLGRLTPIVTASACLGIVALVLGHDPSAGMFVGITYTFYFAFVFVVTYSSALLASLDHSGRLVVAAPAFRTLGTAVGPGIAGLLVSEGDFARLGWFAFAFYLCAAVIFVLAVRAAANTGVNPQAVST